MNAPLYAIADCNSFFVSCERVFRPDLQGRPVVVLSNNDGCIVALSAEAKQAGLRRGDPFFKARGIIERHNVAVFSSNYALYADMSGRVMSTIREVMGDIDVYSIDECFFDVQGVDRYEEWCRSLRRTILRNTGIPVSIGIAPTRTLAKAASKFAKQFPGYRGACAIDTEEKRLKALSLFPVEDVWGIGWASSQKLRQMGINTALQFSCLPETQARRLMRGPGVAVLRELNGRSCTSIEEPPMKRVVTASRTFCKPVRQQAGLAAFAAKFADKCAQRLRKMKGAASAVQFWAATDIFSKGAPQYSNAAAVPLPVPASDAFTISRAAVAAAGKVYRPGVSFKRCGVSLLGVQPDMPRQLSLLGYDHETRLKEDTLSKVIDQINLRHGDCSIYTASQIAGYDGDTVYLQNLRRQFLSPSYTTRLSDVLAVN